MMGSVIGNDFLLRPETHVQGHALAHLRGHELVVNSGDGLLGGIRGGIDGNGFDAHPRLPLRQGLGDAIFEKVARGHVIRFEEELRQAAAELGETDALALLGEQDNPNGLADVGLAHRPLDAPVGAHTRREADAASQNFARIVGHAFAFSLRGRQIRSSGSHQKIMLSRLMKIISTINAHRLMIGMENEHSSPRLNLDSDPRSPFNALLPSATRPIWLRSLSEIRNATFFENLRRPPCEVSTGSGMRMGRAGASGSKNEASANCSVGALTT